MIEEFYYVIGLMSGTSLDGIDLVYVKFAKRDFSTFEIMASKTYDYTKEWRIKLGEAIFYKPLELKSLDLEYGAFLGGVIRDFTNSYAVAKVDFIASHGHTILHRPEEGVTLQIGDGAVIAKHRGIPVICDFRSQDVALGGQGAPLVPIGDRLLFSAYDYCINLGGFANVSFEKEKERIAFDICPVNIVLNHYTRKIGKEFDASGQLAREGTINEDLLNALNKLPFYTTLPPKSLGLEWVQEYVFPLIDSKEDTISRILRTFVEHSAIQIAEVVKAPSKVLYTGGGVFNTFLMERIAFYTKQRVEIPNSALINYKEALIFAFLGVLRFENKVNCLSSVTGASKDHSSGRIFYP